MKIQSNSGKGVSVPPARAERESPQNTAPARSTRTQHHGAALIQRQIVSVVEPESPHMTLPLATARQILDAALAAASDMTLRPLAIAILDERGCLVAYAAQDGSSLMRGDIARGKAYGAVAMGIGSRAIFKRAQEQPFFVDAMNTMANGALVPLPGGVLIRDASGALVGAIGISGESSDNDERCAVAAIAVAGLVAETG